MVKTKIYRYTRFSSDVLRLAYEKICELAKSKDDRQYSGSLIVEHDDATWQHDNIEEFFADYRKYNQDAKLITDLTHIGTKSACKCT